MAIDDFGNYLVQAFLFTIIAFGVVNTVLMSVMHRHREFGVLQALGLTPGQTGAVVLIEGFTLTAISGFLGVGLGLLGTWYFLGDGLDLTAMMENMDEMTFSGVAVDPVIVPLFTVRRIVQVLVFILFVGRHGVDIPGVARVENRRHRSDEVRPLSRPERFRSRSDHPQTIP